MVAQASLQPPLPNLKPKPNGAEAVLTNQHLWQASSSSKFSHRTARTQLHTLTVVGPDHGSAQLGKFMTPRTVKLSSSTNPRLVFIPK
ncbi:unnamed protein product [Prunus armeniaca]|uniref:Uncharacterized protein n=1 Tax=Prunus armeniaca TaxID=36596 RepID=A0A6J5VK55_PRUAR|nr:unnamed protein product [Prunus armeniaca]